MARSSLQYRPTPRDDDALRLAIIRLAKQYGRYGYRKFTQLLHVEGWRVNHKKVERLWREEGFLRNTEAHQHGLRTPPK
ncbi:IS3 family transposase [Ruegeria arenilitoris]|uniref:IS3 family transposase n=1 Tax=Ruegeria arenilitoris TaxID=1173585 RepID=UPI00147C55EF|nr:IS3 family transposase [Ruegeria arenilitoris]